MNKLPDVMLLAAEPLPTMRLAALVLVAASAARDEPTCAASSACLANAGRFRVPCAPLGEGCQRPCGAFLFHMRGTGAKSIKGPGLSVFSHLWPKANFRIVEAETLARASPRARVERASRDADNGPAFPPRAAESLRRAFARRAFARRAFARRATRASMTLARGSASMFARTPGVRPSGVGRARACADDVCGKSPH